LAEYSYHCCIKRCNKQRYKIDPYTTLFRSNKEDGSPMISKTEISSFQLIFLLIHGQNGVGVITLPYDIFVKAKSDAWISVLITGNRKSTRLNSRQVSRLYAVVCLIKKKIY